MEEKNELNDILLHTDEKEGKEKKILFAAIILLFVFFVVLGVMKFTNSESDETNESVKQEVNQTDTNTDGGFEQMALDANSSDGNITQVLQKLKEGSNESVEAAQVSEPPVSAPSAPVASSQTPAVAPATPLKVVPKAPEQAAEVKQVTPPAKKEETTKSVKPVVQKPVEKEVKKSQPQKVAPEVKTAVVKKEVKPQEKSKEVKQAPKALKVEEVKTVKTPPKAAVSGSKAYVQVGNFTGKPKDELLNQIKANGYTYVVKEVVKDGVTTTKVLVGPFESTKVNENIGKIRTNIKSDAFVVRD